jgi:putative transposase
MVNLDVLRGRRSIRLKGYDYSQDGGYFVTVCAYGRECLFGQIENGQMQLNEYGEIVTDIWRNIPEHYQFVQLDEFVVMPNHIHGIIIISKVGAGFKPAPTSEVKYHGLSEIVRAIKTFSARKINILRNTIGLPVWQRNYYEHIIRDEDNLNRIREYIVTNPVRWHEDENNPANM